MTTNDPVAAARERAILDYPYLAPDAEVTVELLNTMLEAAREASMVAARARADLAQADTRMAVARARVERAHDVLHRAVTAAAAPDHGALR